MESGKSSYFRSCSLLFRSPSSTVAAVIRPGLPMTPCSRKRRFRLSAFHSAQDIQRDSACLFVDVPPLTKLTKPPKPPWSESWSARSFGSPPVTCLVSVTCGETAISRDVAAVSSNPVPGELTKLTKPSPSEPSTGFVRPAPLGLHFRHRPGSPMEHRRIHVELFRWPPAFATRGCGGFPDPPVLLQLFERCARRLRRLQAFPPVAVYLAHGELHTQRAGADFLAEARRRLAGMRRHAGSRASATRTACRCPGLSLSGRMMQWRPRKCGVYSSRQPEPAPPGLQDAVSFHDSRV